MQFVPCIRWSGGKRKQSEDIINNMPHSMKTFWIPFLGGGSVMYQLINSNIKHERVIASDIYRPLIDIWKLIQDDPQSLLDSYTIHYENTTSDGESYYETIRAEYNAQPEDAKDPLLFHYLTRSCMRGSIDFDNNGNFTTRFQSSNANRDIISPSNLSNIVMRWNKSIQEVEFRCESYECIADEVQTGDYCFFDPPYIDGTWYHDNNLDMDIFYDFLRTLPCDYSITLNGDRDIYPIPDDCYTSHKYIYYGVKRTASGRPTGSRDSFWMKHTDEYDYSDDIINAKQGVRQTGGKIPQINDIKMMGDIEMRMGNVEGKVDGLDEKLNQILNLLGR